MSPVPVSLFPCQHLEIWVSNYIINVFIRCWCRMGAKWLSFWIKTFHFRSRLCHELIVCPEANKLSQLLSPICIVQKILINSNLPGWWLSYVNIVKWFEHLVGDIQMLRSQRFVRYWYLLKALNPIFLMLYFSTNIHDLGRNPIQVSSTGAIVSVCCILWWRSSHWGLLKIWECVPLLWGF